MSQVRARDGLDIEFDAVMVSRQPSSETGAVGAGTVKEKRVTEPSFDFDTVQEIPPFQGSMPQSKHASMTGALYAVKCWTRKQSELLRVIAADGPLTDHELSERLHLPLSSICSIRNSVRDHFEPCGFDVVQWPDGRTTRRVKWGRRRP